MRKWNWQYPSERWKKLEKYWKSLRNICLITFCTYLVVMKVDLFLALFFSSWKNHIRVMTCDYIRVTYGWHWSIYEWHTDDMQVHMSDIWITYEYILFFPLLLGMLIVVDKRASFLHIINDEEYEFSFSRWLVKHRTP